MYPKHECAGYRNEIKSIPINFPPQLQKSMPGIESIMTPPPIFDNEDYVPSGKLKGKVLLISGGDSGCHYIPK